MTTKAWGTDQSIEQLLFEEAYRFDFYQAVRLLEVLKEGKASPGEGSEPEKEAVQFKAKVTMDMPASEIQDISGKEGNGPVEMNVNFMGLAGSNSPLPKPDAERIIHRNFHKDTGFRDFLDIFNHRLISLLYRVRKTHRIGFDLKPPYELDVARYLFSLFGMGTNGLKERLRVRDESLLYYTPLLAQQPRSMVGLTHLLSDYFNVTVKAHQFRGKWCHLEKDDVTIIGSSGQNRELGQHTIIGRRIWNQHAGFDLSIGPLTLAQWLHLLPTGWGFRYLSELTKLYVEDRFDVYFRLMLKASEVPESRLKPLGGPRLGWTSWLKTGAYKGNDPQVCISSKGVYVPFKFLQGYPIEEVSYLISIMTEHFYPNDDTIITQGEVVSSFFIVKKGSVMILYTEVDGTKKPLTYLNEGAVFGLKPFMTGLESMVTVVTAESSTILALTKERLDEAMALYPGIKRIMESIYQKGLKNKEREDSDLR